MISAFCFYFYVSFPTSGLSRNTFSDVKPFQMSLQLTLEQGQGWAGVGGRGEEQSVILPHPCAVENPHRTFDSPES